MWNGRVGIHDDLSRLHVSSRAADTSREIGYSSITRGEGSLDLLDSDGSVAAIYGDQPDGRFGVALTHGGALRFLPDVFSDLEAEDEALSGRISGLGDRMVSAEGRLDDHNSRISGLGDRMVSAEGTLGSHNTRISAAQARADNAHGDAATAQARADSAYSRAGTGISNAATAQARADAAYSLAEGRATQAQISSLAGTVSSMSSTLNTIVGRVDDIENWLAQYLNYPAPPA